MRQPGLRLLRALFAARWLAALAVAALLGLAALLVDQTTAAAVPAACPYSGGGPAYRFQSWEADRERTLYFDALRLAASNQLFADDEEFALPPLRVGVGSDRREDPTATIPPQLLYAISWVESQINQAAPEVPYGETGPALVSPDCGYGITQVTSSIMHEGSPPTRFEALAGTHFAYNIAAGAQILVEKWNDDFFPQVGGGEPSRIESWYYALWAYNGWALQNHPAGPYVDPLRTLPYPCDGWTEGYAYQERVLGCLVNPPRVDDLPLWDAVQVTLPDLGLLAGPGLPLDPEVYYAAWDEIRQAGGSGWAFHRMHMPLSQDGGAFEPTAALDDFEAAALRERVLGAPRLRFDDAELELGSSVGSAPAAALVIENEGTGLLTWRVARAPSWLDLEAQAGVAVGGGWAFAAASPSRLVVRAAAGGVPEGEHVGELRLEASLPNGSTVSRAVTVVLNKLEAASYRAGTPRS